MGLFAFQGFALHRSCALLQKSMAWCQAYQCTHSLSCISSQQPEHLEGIPVGPGSFVARIWLLLRGEAGLGQPPHASAHHGRHVTVTLCWRGDAISLPLQDHPKPWERSYGALPEP